MCSHGVTDQMAYDRWTQAEQIILACAEDEQDAQWDALGGCWDCGGPAKLAVFCTRCDPK